jgi:hypothetical protein
VNDKPIPQLGPAMALVQLLQSSPGLRRIGWSLADDGHLTGSNMRMEKDPRPLMAEYVAALGGTASEFWSPAGADTPRFSTWLHVTWQDVELSVWMGCAASLAPREVAQVAA